MPELDGLELLRFPDLAHPALSDLLEQSVVTDQWGIVRGCTQLFRLINLCIRWGIFGQDTSLGEAPGTCTARVRSGLPSGYF